MTSPSNVEKFIATIAHLRAPNGCPWDREQTHRTLARFLLEEAYEVLEAIQLQDEEKLKEELGDLFLQVVLNAQVAADANQFNIEDVAQAINEKMIRRHPHVFAEASCTTAQEVLSQWDDLKAKEEKQKQKSVLDGIPPTLPALMQALKVSEKAVAQGFEWTEEKDLWLQLDSELGEFRQAAEIYHQQKHSGDALSKDKARFELDLELGDILFTVVNIGRFHGLNGEESLLHALTKFKRRFEHMEQLADRPLKELTFSQWETLWRKAKKNTATLDIL